MKNFVYSSLLFAMIGCADSPQRPAIFQGTSDAAGVTPTKESDSSTNEGDEKPASPTPTPSPSPSVPSSPTPGPNPNPVVPAPSPMPALPASKDIKKVNILVFSKTAGFRHDGSIKSGLTLIRDLSTKNGFKYEVTEDAAKITKEYLATFDAVFFLCTTGDIFNAEQQTAFEHYIKGGGGYFGVHSATDTEYDWPWYGKLVGAFFDGHEVFESKLTRNDKTHVSTVGLPDEWKIRDEWYRFKSFSKDDVKILLTLDDSPNTNPSVPHTSHPIAWYHDFDGGRAWYSGLGHFDDVWTNALFQKHLYGGLLYASGVTNVTP